MSAFAALLRKDLLLEARRRETVPAMALFTVTVFVVFRFGLDRTSVAGDLASGVLWVTLLLAALLGMNRLWALEHEQGGFEAFLLSPASRAALLAAKVTALLAFLAVVELIALPAFAVLLLGPSLLPALGSLLVVVALTNLGLAVVVTLTSTLAVQTRARELIGPLIALPLLIPLLLAAAAATTPLLYEDGPAPLEADRWLGSIALYDLVFSLLAYAVFDFLAED